MKNSRYMDRAMRSSDPRFAKVLGKLGHVPTKPAPPVGGVPKKPPANIGGEPKPPVPPKPSEVGGGDMAILRAQYEAKFGKRPFPGWNADALRTKLSEKADADRYARRDMRAED